MKRLLVGLVFVGLLSSPGLAQQSKPNTPSATLSAEADGGIAFQSSKVIFSSWKGEEFDDSFPPVLWPRALRVSSPEVTLTIDSPELPDLIEVRQWRSLKRNGIPKGEPHITECYIVAVGCSLQPAISAPGFGWQVTAEVPWRGHTYIALASSWPDGQVSWINHIFLERR